MTQKAVVILLETDIQSTRRIKDMVHRAFADAGLKGDIRVLQVDKVKPLLKYPAKSR